jgi:hypothetical protein
MAPEAAIARGQDMRVCLSPGRIHGCLVPGKLVDLQSTDQVTTQLAPWCHRHRFLQRFGKLGIAEMFFAQ